jgi:hypothetical protein
MKKLTTEEVFNIFLECGCELLSQYERSDAPLTYRCRCGLINTISLDKMRARIKKGNGCKQCNSNIWNSTEDEILCLNYGVVPRKDLLEKLPGKNYNDIKNRAFKLKLKGNLSFVQSKARLGKGRKYDINFDYFDNINLQTSYWSGFIAAVGDVNDDRNRISLRVVKCDRLHLDLFKEAVGYTGKIYELSDQVLIQCHGVYRWIEMLRKNYFITPRKSSSLQPPTEIDEENSLAFICGYIDGKGKIKLSEDKLVLEVFGTQDVLCWIKVWFDRLCPSVSRRYAVVRPDKKNQFRYVLSGQRAGYLLRRLINLNVPRIERKWKQVG